MQTFLPLPDYHLSAWTLDRQRLGKQRVEGVQLLRIELARQQALAAGDAPPSTGWARHPASLAWAGHGHALGRYVLACCEEWTTRGYTDTQADVVRALVAQLPGPDRGDPPWLGDAQYHLAQRSNLLRKAPSWYGRLGPWAGVPADLPYCWPVP